MILKNVFNFKYNQVVGLDIGSTAVKLVQLHKDDIGWAVTAAGIADIRDSHDYGRAYREINTIEAIRDCIQSSGIQTQYTICSVSGPEVAVRCFQFPSLPAEEIPGAVMLEAEQVCPFDIKNCALDYQLIPNGPSSVRGVLVAATNDIIKRKRQLIKDAHLNNVLIDTDGLALLNCFEGFSSGSRPKSEFGREYSNSIAGQTIAILNIGSSFTNLAIISPNVLPFIRDIMHGGDEIINTIATEHNIPIEAAGEILAGAKDSGITGLKFAESLKHASQNLITDIVETLRYYTTQEKSIFIEKIFVCGGYALNKGFVKLLDNQLDTKVSLWNPFEKVRCDAGQPCRDILKKNGPALAVAAGLAMRTM